MVEPPVIAAHGLGSCCGSCWTAPAASAPVFIRGTGTTAAGTTSGLMPAGAPGFSGQSANLTGCNSYFLLLVGTPPGIQLSQEFSCVCLPRPFHGRPNLLVLWKPLMGLWSLNRFFPARCSGGGLKKEYAVEKSRRTRMGRGLERPTCSLRIR